MNRPSVPLFRPESRESHSARLYGEIVVTPTAGTRIAVGTLVLLLCLGGSWAALGSYSRTETARGILVTDTPSVKVVALRSGTVVQLLVREGDAVSQGQRLAVVRMEQNGERGESAIEDGLTAIAAQEAVAGDQVRNAGAKAASERARVRANIQALQRQRAALAEETALQKEAIASASDLVERVRGAVEKGFVSRLEYERRRQTLLAARQELARLAEQESALGGQQGAGQAELDRIDAEAASEAAGARMSAGALAQRRIQLRAERGYAIVAPVAGRIASVQTATGRATDVSIPLLEIVPSHSRLHAEIYAPTRAIGFVKAGQEARLLYDAFPFQRFGSFSGRITRVSTAVLDPRQVAQPLKLEEAVYRIEVTPGEQEVKAFGEAIPLQAGMAVSANLVLDRRTFLDWLLQPLRAMTSRTA
jgi:membrane fusion protein